MTTASQPGYDRRLKEGYFEKWLKGKGIDIGCGPDVLPAPDCLGWDLIKGCGDATFMEGVADESFDFVFSSHCLEHLSDAVTAIRNWFRILKPGGFMVIEIPHRDLYEKRTTLPSRFNGDHKHFWLPDRAEPPCTFSLLDVMRQGTEGKATLVHLMVMDGGDRLPPEVHSLGPFSIEIVVQK